MNKRSFNKEYQSQMCLRSSLTLCSGVAGSLFYKDKTEDWTRKHSAKSKSVMPYSKQVINQSMHPRSRCLWHFCPTPLLECCRQDVTLQTGSRDYLSVESEERKRKDLYVWVFETLQLRVPTRSPYSASTQTTSSTYMLRVGNQTLSYPH